MTMIVHGYRQHGDIAVTLNGVDLIIPDDMENRHRQMLADWVASGKTIPLYVAPDDLPEE